MIPEGWTRSEISKLVAFKSGGTPSKSNAAFWGNAYPWVSAKDMKFHYIRDSIDKLSPIGFDGANKAQPGDILILVRGMTLLKDVPVGKVLVPLAFNQDIKALTPKKIHSEYFLYCLRGQKRNLMRLVDRANHGTGRLSTDLLGALPVLLPPLAEQKRIAEILSTWDRAIAATEKLIANSEAQKKALMQQLLTGKKRLPGFKGEWKVTKIGKVCNVTTGQPAPNENSAFGESGLPFIRVSSLSKLKSSNVSEFEFVSEQAAKEWGLQRFGPGTLIFAKSGMSAKLGKIELLDRRAYLVSHLAALTAKNANDIRFIKYWFEMNSPGQLVQGDGFPSIRTSEIKFLSIRIPEVQEQEAVAEAIEATERAVRDLVDIKCSLESEKSALMQQLLTGKRRVKIKGEAQAA